MSFKIDAGQIAKDDPPPEIGLRYFDSTGQTELEAPPNRKGVYIAEAVLLNADSSNYKLAATYRQTFEIFSTPIPVPSTEKTSFEYTGSEIEFKLTNFDAALIFDPEIKTDGMRMTTGADGAVSLFAKDVKRYEIQFRLRDTGNYCWDTGGTGTASLFLEITGKPLTLTFARENNNWQWDTGTNGQFTVTHDGVEGDNVALVISYVKADGTKVAASNVSVAGKTTTVTLLPLEKGNYTLVAELVKAQAGVNSNGNYVLRQEYLQPFTVVGRQATLPALKWKISVGGITSDLAAGQTFSYQGREFSVSLDTSDFPANGVDIKADSWQNNRFTVVGNYTTSVTITAYDSGWDFTDQTVQISWSVIKALYDLSNTTWNYNPDSPPVYSGAPQNISLLNLPAGLTPNYTRNYTDATSDGDTYHTRVQAFLNDDPDNYVTPVFGNADSYLGADFLWELDWVIAKKPIELSWMMTTKKDSNGRTFQYPTLAVDANRVVFTFYTESDVEIPLDNIAVRQGHEDGYYVIASLNEETAKNYRLNGSLTRFEFVVGRVATAVSILQITNSGTAYSARPQAATFTFTDGIALTADDFALSYFVGENAAEGEAPLDGAPTDAGKYRVRFSLQANENTKSFYIDGEDTFAYEIVKATLDVSEAKWNYENPFSYAIENGAEKVYEVRLIGLPDYLDKLATYTGAQRNSMVSTNNVTVSFANFDTKNYEPFTLPEALNASAAGGVISASLTWEIVPRELARPVYTGGKIVYDGAARNLFDLVRFPDDKETYINIAITKSGNPAFDGSNTVKDAGRYVVTCRIKDEFINNGGVVWKGGDTLAQAAVVEITPLELVATGWSNKPPRPVFANSSVKRDYYSVTYYLTEGGANEEVSEGNLTDAQYHGKTFRARVTIPDGMKNNVSLRLQGTLDTTDFIMFEPGSETSLKKPTIKVASYEYDGEEHEFEISGINVKYMIVSGSLFRTEVGVSKITITLNPKENVEWEDFEVNKYEEVVLEIEITKGKISAGEADWNTDDMPPTLYLEGDKINAVEYTYQTQSGAPVAADKLKPNTKYYVIANIKEEYLDKYGFDAGSYLSEASEGYLFTYILYVELPTLKTATFVYDGSAHEITADSFEGFEDKYLEIKGTLTFRDAGEYDIVFSIKEGTGAVWKKSGNADDQTVRLTITKAIVVVTWDNYSYRTPKAILDGFPANAFVYEYIDALTGSVVPSTALVDGANYQTRIRLSDKYALNYMFEETQSAVSDAQFFTLSGNRPIDPSNPIVPGEGDNPSDKTIEPLPQIILSGIGIVLTVVFAIMTINYASVVKSATEKRKKLAQMTYSFAPTGLLALLFGFSESNWWIVAGVSLGAALITAIVMFMFRKKSKKALALLEEEKERVEAEKEYAKEERTRMDQQRRDEEMRMMFAAMQQQNAQQPQMQYNDMRAMLAETVSALLPAIQQVQALPPAADPSQYGDPYAAQQPYGAPQQPYAAPQQPYAMPQQPYGAPQQPYGAPQQPYAAPAPDPNETEALRAQIAQQQEMLNRILQNQQAQQTQQAEPKPVYADSYAAGEDLSWLGESSETVSLEELYGNLSDEGKRCYYEIGSYIMGKPQTSQNDGKYAVLFKYRGKTLFKLCILNNAPVLYYLSDYGARAELFITDIHVLETAKAIVDHLYERTDRELG